jgi:plasmid stability protein
VRQVITRVEDELHARLKVAAAARGVSVNAFVVDALTAAVGGTDARGTVRRRAEAAGKRVVPPAPEETPSWDDVVAAGARVDSAVSDALTEERAGR